jgi:AraC-like DNA-binding protein
VQLAFRRHLNTTPMAYLQQVRLERARAELLAADPRQETVTALALRWGFSSPSRFSALYRRAYGTVPSKTLHQG